jgi:hypothetical protein
VDASHSTNSEIIKKAIDGLLGVVEQPREREIISRRFGINSQKETLEQIGEMLNITRERVRQLEKAIVIRIKIHAEEGKVENLVAAEKLIIRNLIDLGRVARTETLTKQIYGHKSTAKERSVISFIGEMSSQLSVICDGDKYYHSICIAEYGDEKAVRMKADEIVKTITAHKNPMTATELDEKLDYQHPDHIVAIAHVSKQLATLGGLWGLAKWPSINPRNIRDKIFVILQSKKVPMHFSEIARAITESNFKRKNVTVQAIHNELIKDERFVLIGRGIYALNAWGYSRGTVTDTIKKVLIENGGVMERNEIVKQVLRARQVKETTVLLNLQDRAVFNRIDKNKYAVKK